ncbi:MAG: thioredoxin family protein [Alcaligenaceae bacterium]|nr:thioredoxin family protein [Alcaligenaceae bacterium]
MNIFNPADHRARLLERLQALQGLVITCFCADWCNTCKQYAPAFAELARRHPEHCFVWLDIEDHENLLGDDDIENFPTLQIQNGTQTVFFGPLLPYIEHLEKLVDRAERGELPAVTADTPAPLQERLASGA